MSETTHTTENRDYTVEGMTCSHCVLSAREEVSEVPGVSAVDVELASGRMAVTGQDIDDDAIRAAVADAGYEAARSTSSPAST
jgi:copper chaperone